ncbi:sodium:proton antiporter [Salinibacter sp. 10B]|uniref:Na+/H+ antiporter NhaC family protein n=1 Tax=Salinibacter sp. 10B TaxID=1923971 RepID=UPI000CF49621|nr:Na+/H+ antiporter NhaC family protein [Salinibacter sp. 10B]PQJ33405.1 sodium:proton antiporter [Salinibacter sp. 10B]
MPDPSVSEIDEAESSTDSEAAPEGSPDGWMRWAIAALVLGGLGIAVYFAGDIPKTDGHYGFWSILPPLIAIVLAFWMREVVSALFIGIAAGGLIAGKVNIIDAFLLPAIGTEDFALILLVYLWALGGLIGLWTRTGGALRFASWAGERMVRGPKTAKFFTWIMGLVFHQGGTISTVLTGATARPIGDQHDVSHEELSYVVDSTASPAATLIPFNVWPIYVGGLVAGTIPLFETAQDGITFFFSALPFNFYAIFAVAMTFLFAWEVLPWVPGKQMREAMDRARSTGKLDRDGATPLTSRELTEMDVPDDYAPGLIDFLAPIGTLLGVAILPYIVTYFFMGWTGGQNPDPMLLIAEAFVLAVLAGMGIALFKGMDFDTVIDGFIDGCKGVTIGAIILALAVSLKEVADAVGTANYVVATVGDVLTPAILPGLLLVLCVIIAFSTGTSWGTYAVVFPVAMPLAWSVSQDPFFITLCFSAVVGGSVYGDQCSPISDTTVLSSLATGSDLMDHVYTQLPLASVAGGLAIVVYTLMVVFFV